jgi:hypothetical protein
MAQLARPRCSSKGCTRNATTRVDGKWLCGKHLKSEPPAQADAPQ